MKLSYLKDFNNLLNPIKNLILIFAKKNRLVDAEYSRRIFYFSKVLYFYNKKSLQTCKEIKTYKYNIFLSDG